MPWAETSSKFTLPFEDHAGYLAQRADKTTLSELMRIAWATVGAIIRRVVARLGDRDILDDLTHVGVDELSYPERCAKLEVVTIDMSGANIQAVTECSPQAN